MMSHELLGNGMPCLKSILKSAPFKISQFFQPLSPKIGPDPRLILRSTGGIGLILDNNTTQIIQYNKTYSKPKHTKWNQFL